MGKAVKAIGIGVAIIGLAVLTGGISIGPTLTGSLAAGTAAIGTALTTTALGGLALSLGAGMILTGFSTLMRSTPKIPLGHLDRLNASLNPTAPRTMVFGQTALGTDIRYVYPSGTDQRYIDYIIGLACHEVESIDEVWIEDRKAWSSASGYESWTIVGGVNRLTITTRTEGTSGNAINIGGAWTGSARLTGCAYLRLRIDREGTKKTDSPFSSGLASRITIRGKGMPLYDPRLDSTNGGSGAHRVLDQATWGTTTGRDNPALQILAYLIGWRIGGKLSVGRGVPMERIDFASFITAANICDEDVALAAGGTQDRYRSAALFNENDDTNSVLGTLLTACAGELRETGGKLGLYVLTNDLASPVAYFDDNNILSQFEWSGEADLTETPNVVRGRWTDPSDNALYNFSDYPEHSITSLDDVERIMQLDLAAVQDGNRAQRIAKQALQRAQYTGTFSAEFDIEAWKCQVGDVVAVSFEPLGWSNKLFRVVQMAIRQDGRVPMVLREENAAIYAWAADELAVVTAATPTTFDPLNAGAILAAVEAQAAADAAQATNSVNLYRVETAGHVTSSATSPVAFAGALVEAANIYLDEAGLVVGDIVSPSIEIRNVTPVDKVRMELRFFDGPGSSDIVSTVAGDYIDSTSFTRVSIPNVTIPAGAIRMQIIIRRESGSGTIEARNGMVNRGPIPAPYSAPSRGATNANQNLFVAANVVDVTTTTSPVALVPGSAPLVSALGVPVGAPISLAAHFSAMTDPWRLEVRSRDISNTILSDTRTGPYSSSAGIRVIDGYVPHPDAYRIETIARRESGSGSITISRQMLNRGPFAADFAAPYEAGSTNGADWSSNVTNRPTELTDGRVLAGLNSDGTIKAGKVGYTAMSADVLQEIVSATASNITATDAGTVMLSLEDVTVKPSQGGYVHLILTSAIKLAPIASPGGLSVIYARLQRSPANAGTWAEVQSWLLGSAKCPTYFDDGVGDAVDDYEITIGAAAQYIDVPGSDGDYDYRWLASKTSDGTGLTPASTSAGVAKNAQGLAISTKVAA